MITSSNVTANTAYGLMRSSFLPMDAVLMAVQGAALGVLFGNPLGGAIMGAIMSVTDRFFAPVVSQLPGPSIKLLGVPLGKNIVLLGVSALIAFFAMPLCIALIK